MKRHIPNIITLLNVFCGSCAIVAVLSGQIALSFILLFFGLLADYLDGAAARLLHVKSSLGIQLDSLADAVTFGVLPGMMLYYILGEEARHNGSFPQVIWEISPVFMLSLFSVLRLGKFNLDTRQTNHFLGLPTPSSTVLVAGLLAIYHYDSFGLAEWVNSKTLIFALVAFLSWLMVSDVPMFNLKFTSMKWAGNEIKFIFVTIGILLLVLLGVAGPSTVVLLYILFNLGRYWLQKKSVEKT